MPERVLIIKLGALGDVALAIPHIERIRESYPDGEVHLLTAPEYAELFAAHPALRVTAFPRRGARAMLATSRWIRQQRFDAVYDLQGSERSYFFTRLSGAAMRAGLGPRFIYTRRNRSDRRSAHISVRLGQLLDRCGLPPAKTVPQIYVSEDTREQVSRWLRENQAAQRPFALVHAGSSASWLSKRWDESCYRAFAGTLLERGCQVIWTGSADDAALNARLVRAGGLDTSGLFTLTELAELARHARFALTTDSGPMHIFATAGIPVFALFGPTDWRRSHAMGQEDRVLARSVPCGPCYRGTCPVRYAHRCMKELTPEFVIDRLQRDGLV